MSEPNDRTHDHPLLERSKLYKDVWSKPCTKIAAGLGISSSELKRICTELDIPRRVPKPPLDATAHISVIRVQGYPEARWHSDGWAEFATGNESTELSDEMIRHEMIQDLQNARELPNEVARFVTQRPS